MATNLMQIEAIRQEFSDLPLTLTVLAALRETARLASVHYSTKIEGNRLTQEEVARVIKKSEHFPGREQDEKEILGYYAALQEVEWYAEHQAPITQETIKKIHALVLAGGKKKIIPTPYREGQNVIRDSGTRAIVYLPPKAHDVPALMSDLVEWLEKSRRENFPHPLRAALAHYQFTTIHPYYDGNGRIARLLTTLILHKAGYSLKGTYSLEEYYVKDLPNYYAALDRGPSHNYYMGRAEADITPWIEYFCSGMLHSFIKIRDQAARASQEKEADRSAEIKKLNARQRKVLNLFEKSATITARDIATLFSLNPRTARALCQQWTVEGFLAVACPAKKTRTYTRAGKI